jgi:hypothetical protein
MSDYTALLDANILYSAPMRDIFLQLAVADLFQVKWTQDIHCEWIEALLKKEPHRKRTDLERTRRLMDLATRDCLIYGYEPLISSLNLPDPRDRHVLAAAIVGRCDVIVTQNLKDFPCDALSSYGIEAQHPDDFLSYHLNLSPRLFCRAIQKVRQRLKNPPYNPQEYLSTLRQQGLVTTASKLTDFISLI